MNIAIVVDSLAVGGAERQAILCVSELRKLGHSVDLIHYHPRVEFVQMLERSQVQPIYVAAATFVQRCRLLRQHFLRRDYDVVHGFKMAAEVYAALAGAWARVPRRFGSYRSIYAAKFKSCLTHFLVDKLLDGWIVNSQVGAESMAKHTRISLRKIQVVRNALPPEMLLPTTPSDGAKQRLGIPNDALVVTSIARLEAPKNHRMFLTAAARVNQRFPGVCFLVIGKGSLLAELRQYAADLGLSERAIFLGERFDIPEILAATDISVLTSDYEGLPNAIIEAMAAGKPVVCTSYRGHAEIMTHESNALLSPCGDANAFAGHLLRLISDPPLRQRLGNNARQYARAQFSPEAMARQLEFVYKGRASGSGVKKS